MQNEPPMSRIGSLIGSPARALMLGELFDGRALTATELASVAGVSGATASEHLALLLAGGFMTREKSGRHQYYRLASAEIAGALEQLVAQTALVSPTIKTKKHIHTPMQNARMCYDHIAGRLGVAIADGLVENEMLIVLGNDYELTSKGKVLLGNIGINVNDLSKSKRLFARRCLDWSERRHHVAGAVGAAIADVSFEKGWIERAKERRVLSVTPKGKMQLKALIGINL